MRVVECLFGASLDVEVVNVIPVVFIIGVLNLMLGFALAVLLERQVVVPIPLIKTEPKRVREVVLEVPLEEPAPLDAVRETLPKRWIELLEERDVQFSSFVEASVEILKLEVTTYREDLLDIEDLVRSAILKRKPEAIHDALQVLVGLNEEWMTRQHEALEVMEMSRDKLGEYDEIGNDLESVLLDQTSLIDSECCDLSSLEIEGDDATTKKIIGSIGNLVEMAHDLRDRIKKAALLIICNEGRLDTVDQDLQVDEITGLQNRMGIERIFKTWWREDEQRRRLVSVALIDIDRFREVNEAVSTRVADRILKNFAIYLEQLIGSESGLERAFRYSGQSFFLFFGDSGPRAVTTKVERIRQTIQATKMEYQGKRHELTVRAGVTEVQADDDTKTLFKRLESLTETARHAGRNRTVLDDASGSGIVQPEQMKVKKRIIKVE